MHSQGLINGVMKSWPQYDPVTFKTVEESLLAYSRRIFSKFYVFVGSILLWLSSDICVGAKDQQARALPGTESMLNDPALRTIAPHASPSPAKATVPLPGPSLSIQQVACDSNTTTTTPGSNLQHAPIPVSQPPMSSQAVNPSQPPQSSSSSQSLQTPLSLSAETSPMPPQPSSSSSSQLPSSSQPPASSRSSPSQPPQPSLQPSLPSQPTPSTTSPNAAQSSSSSRPLPSSPSSPSSQPLQPTASAPPVLRQSSSLPNPVPSTPSLTTAPSQLPAASHSTPIAPLEEVIPPSNRPSHEGLGGFDDLPAGLQGDYKSVVSKTGWGDSWASLVKLFIEFELNNVS